MTETLPRRLVTLVLAVTAVIVTVLALGAWQGPATAATSPTPSRSTSEPVPAVSASPTPIATGSSSPGVAPSTLGITATRIVVPRLGIDLPIVEGDGVDAPMHKAAHFPGTAWPDEGSNIYVYAHAREEMFRALWRAEVGDEIFLELVDGSERIYTVTEIRPSVPWNALELLQPTSDEQLTLQTCIGPNDTDPRFIVIARPRA